MVKGQAQITKFYFLLVGTINMQSLSGQNLMRQQVPMVISIHLVFVTTVVCICEGITLGPCWHKNL